MSQKLVLSAQFIQNDFGFLHFLFSNRLHSFAPPPPSSHPTAGQVTGHLQARRDSPDHRPAANDPAPVGYVLVPRFPVLRAQNFPLPDGRQRPRRSGEKHAPIPPVALTGSRVPMARLGTPLIRPNARTVFELGVRGMGGLGGLGGHDIRAGLTTLNGWRVLDGPTSPYFLSSFIPIQHCGSSQSVPTSPPSRLKRLQRIASQTGNDSPPWPRPSTHSRRRSPPRPRC